MDRDTKLIAILRRQYHIILTALGENIFRIGSDSAQYGIYFLPTSRQYNVVSVSKSRFIGYPNTSNFVKNTPLCVVVESNDETMSLVFDILHQTRKTVFEHISKHQNES